MPISLPSASRPGDPTPFRHQGLRRPVRLEVYITQHGRRCCETMQGGEGKEEREADQRHQSEGCMNITGSDSTCTFFICLHAGSSLSPSVM